VRFLGVLQQAKNLQRTRRHPDAAVGRRLPVRGLHFRELASENAVPIERADKTAPSIGGGGTPGVTRTADPTPSAAGRRRSPPARRAGVDRRLDTTLYFWTTKRSVSPQGGRARIQPGSARQRARHAVRLAGAADLRHGSVRADLIVENFIPYLLGAGDFRSVAFILRECKVILQRARELIPEHRQVLEALPTRLSQADALSQLLQSLDEATSIHRRRVERAVRGAACRSAGTLMGCPQALQRAREVSRADVCRAVAVAHAAEVLKALASADPAFSSRWSGWRPLKPPVRRGHGPAAGTWRTASQARRGGGADDDRQPGCDTPAGRPSRRRARRPHHGRQFSAAWPRNAFSRIEAAVRETSSRHGPDGKDGVLRAYGALAGEAGTDARKLLSKGRALGGKRIPDPRLRRDGTRKIRTPKARDVLQKVRRQEPLVRTRSTGTPRRRGGGGGGGAGHDDARGKRPR